MQDKEVAGDVGTDVKTHSGKQTHKNTHLFLASWNLACTGFLDPQIRHNLVNLFPKHVLLYFIKIIGQKGALCRPEFRSHSFY